jgi:hypothetical protein
MLKVGTGFREEMYLASTPTFQIFFFISVSGFGLRDRIKRENILDDFETENVVQ